MKECYSLKRYIVTLGLRFNDSTSFNAAKR